MSEYVMGTKRVVVTVLEVSGWDTLGETYNHVHLFLPGGYDRRITPQDAQRLGQHLAAAGGMRMVPAPEREADSAEGNNSEGSP